MRKTILTLFMVLLISGCTGSDFFQGLMPGFEDQEVKELPPDVVTIESLTVIPNPPINANDQFSVSFIIKNQDDINTVKDVEYNLFDDGLCEWSSSSASLKKNNYDLVPLQEEFVEWTFDAPENDEIASLSTTCPIRFNVDYNLLSRSQIDVQVIEDERLREIQRSGETASFTPTLTLGRGPVKVYVSFGSSLPVRGSKDANNDGDIEDDVDRKGILPVYILVEDKGNGLYGQIPGDESSGNLVIRVPREFNIDSLSMNEECGKFNIVSNQNEIPSSVTYDSSNYKYYRNEVNISLIRKKTAQLRCSFEVPWENRDFTLEKAYYITAFLDYDYTITGETEVAIEPTAG